MKKLLAMVLALMTMVSLVVTANAAKLSDMTDAEAVDSTYEIAVGLLTDAGVIGGYPDGSFRPQGNVTRAEMAKMICYALLGKTMAEQLPASREIFSDVPTDFWAAKYIQYCYSQGIVGGHGDGTFAPNDNVTGYQAAKMILVTKGHTKDGAYEGTGWETKVAADAMETIFKGSKTASFNAAATREEAAYYIYNGFTTESVTYLSGLEVAVGNGSYVLAAPVTKYLVRDNYGRPGYKYDIVLTATDKLATYTVWVDAKTIYMDAKIECELAQTLGIKNQDSSDAYFVDGAAAGSVTIDRFDTVDSFGCQGTQTEVYVYDNKMDIVQIHTYLAQVVKKRAAVKDALGCVKVPAQDDLEVYGIGDVIVDATSFKKETFLRVQGYWKNRTFVVDKMEEAPAVRSTLSDIVYDKFGQIYGYKVNGKTVPINCTLTYGEELLILGDTVYLFHDAKGNMIGAAELEPVLPVWCINTEIVYIHSNGLNQNSKVLANMVNFDGTKLNGGQFVTLDDEALRHIDDNYGYGDPASATVSDNLEENVAYQLNKLNRQNYFYGYLAGEGGYDLYKVPVVYTEGIEIKNSNRKIELDDDHFVLLDSNTRIIIKNGDTYTAVKGYSSLKALKNGTLWYEEQYVNTKNENKVLRYTVLDITDAIYEGSNLNAIVFDGAKQSETSKSFIIKAWVGTELKTYEVLKSGVGVDTFDLYASLDFDAFQYDQWKLYFNLDGQVVKAELQTGNYYEVIAKGADVMTINSGEKAEQMSTLSANFYAVDEINELVKAGSLAGVPMFDSTTYVVVAANKAYYVYYSVNKD